MGQIHYIKIVDPESKVERNLNARWEVCPLCDGEGSHVNPSIDGNGLTAQDLEDWDPEDFRSYMSGTYDVACWFCNGSRLILVPDIDYLDLEDDESDILFYELWEEEFDDRMNQVDRGMRRAGGSFINEEY